MRPYILYVQTNQVVVAFCSEETYTSSEFLGNLKCAPMYTIGSLAEVLIGPLCSKSVSAVDKLVPVNAKEDSKLWNLAALTLNSPGAKKEYAWFTVSVEP